MNFLLSLSNSIRVSWSGQVLSGGQIPELILTYFVQESLLWLNLLNAERANGVVGFKQQKELVDDYLVWIVVSGQIVKRCDALMASDPTIVIPGLTNLEKKKAAVDAKLAQLQSRSDAAKAFLEGTGSLTIDEAAAILKQELP